MKRLLNRTCSLLFSSLPPKRDLVETLPTSPILSREIRARPISLREWCENKGYGSERAAVCPQMFSSLRSVGLFHLDRPPRCQGKCPKSAHYPPAAVAFVAVRTRHGLRGVIRSRRRVRSRARLESPLRQVGECSGLLSRQCKRGGGRKEEQ